MSVMRRFGFLASMRQPLETSPGRGSRRDVRTFHRESELKGRLVASRVVVAKNQEDLRILGTQNTASTE